MQRKHSKNRRSTRQRKQPTIPINSNLAQHQQKIFAKLNLKQQNSLTSSDENLNDFDLVQKDKKLRIGAQDNENEFEQTDFLEDEEDENEDANNIDDDVDEEIRSTTEYTTNDEMDLESGSVSISANALGVNSKHNSNVANKTGSNLQSREFTSLDNSNKNSIDDYLMQNLEKDEILAAKMSKFLSVSVFCLLGFKFIQSFFVLRAIFIESLLKNCKFNHFILFYYTKTCYRTLQIKY
jgi:hypothetical protein